MSLLFLLSLGADFLRGDLAQWPGTSCFGAANTHWKLL